MLDAIRRFLGGKPEHKPSVAEQHGVDPLHLAACVLLLEVAYADGDFSAEEHRHLSDVLKRQFDLAPDQIERLLDIAEEERRRAVDHFKFTSILQRDFSLGQKMVLAEVMWGLVISDGKIAEREDTLTRKFSRLLDLQPGYLATAKESAVKAAQRRD